MSALRFVKLSVTVRRDGSGERRSDPMTIDEYLERDIASLRSDFMQVSDIYIDPPLAKKDKNKIKSLIEDIEASLKVER